MSDFMSNFMSNLCDCIRHVGALQYVSRLATPAGQGLVV